MASKIEESLIVYGKQPVCEALEHRLSSVEKVFIQNKKDGGPDERLARLVAGLDGSQVKKVNQEELDSLSNFSNHQGVVAKLSSQNSVSINELCQAASKKTIVALDEISDPQNLGSIFRVSEAAGVGAILNTKRRSASVTGVVRKASAGASEVLPICEVSNLVRALEELKKAGYWIIGTSLSAESQELYTSELPEPAVVVLGSEGKGLRPLVAKHCDVLISIPMQGKIQSLNVSQAAAVVLFELVRSQKQ